MAPRTRRSVDKATLIALRETVVQDLPTTRRTSRKPPVVLTDATNTEAVSQTRPRPLRRSPRHAQTDDEPENSDFAPPAPAPKDDAEYEPTESEESSTSYLATASSQSDSEARRRQTSDSSSACPTSEWSESTRTDITDCSADYPFLQPSSVSEETDSPGFVTDAEPDVPYSYPRFRRKIVLSEQSADSDDVDFHGSTHSSIRPIPTRESSVGSCDDSDTRVGTVSHGSTPEPVLYVLASTPKIDLPSSPAFSSDGSHHRQSSWTGSADVSDNCNSSSFSSPLFPSPNPADFSGPSGVHTSEDTLKILQATLIEVPQPSSATSCAHKLPARAKSPKSHRDQLTPVRTSARKNPTAGLGPKHLEYDLQKAREELREATINACIQLGYKPRPRRLNASRPSGLMTRRQTQVLEAEKQAVWKPSLEQVNAANFWYVKRAKRRHQEAYEKLQEAKARGETWDNTPVPSLSLETKEAISEPFLPSDRTGLFDSQEYKSLDFRAHALHCEPEVDAPSNVRSKRNSDEVDNVEDARPRKRLRSRGDI
ncbi:hypothetical protein K474DRAFT_1659264 [Panus rudis PR-1116 ss-1]|nr:hypothetical protein K474DRAFT_1659264 [Panus rudis PR-1116 ss-1]